MSPAASPNVATYYRDDVVRHYSQALGLFPAEKRLLRPLTLQHVRLLDLGVGGGRTSGPLARRVRDYTGVDYSPAMIVRARARHPHLRFLCLDARDLPMADESFDMVVFSFNGIDYCDHADRLRILAEIRRVLTPHGRLLFSSHNRDYARLNYLPWQPPLPLAHWDQERVSRSLNALVHTPRRLRMRRLTASTPSWALVNDDAHGYRLLTYYVRARDQVRQLRSNGFTAVAVYDQRGHPLSAHDGDLTVVDRSSVWLYYQAHKRGRGAP